MKKIFTLLVSLFALSAIFGQTVNLFNYVRVGRYDLPEPTRTVAPANSLLAQEVSGVTYNWDTQTLFVVGDGGTSVVQVSKTGVLINSMTLAPGASPQNTEFYDPEGITYIGNGQFVMTEERDRQAVLFTYAAGTTLTRAATKTVKLGTFVQNIGLEGLTFDPVTGGFIFVKETGPLGIFQTSIDFNAGTASNGSPSTENSINLFDPALAGVLDFADVFALSNLPALSGQPNYGNLLVLSQESAKIVNIDRLGNISSSLTIVSDPGNPLTAANQQHEGLTMDRDGILYVVSENGGGDFDHPQLWVYAPSTAINQAPTAISLSNIINSIPENTSTLSPIKVADISIADDGQGANNLTISGPDAAFFQITGASLFIKAGTILDFETKVNYNITVNVDDVSVGNTPDATVNYSLSLTDVLVENPVSSALTISEVSPWSSGNSPVGADWFEVTNNTSSPVNINGWKMDDNSNTFAAAVALNGITTIAPGESVIFLETATPATTISSFLNTWFGVNPPAGLQVGSYTGGGVGLSTGGDAVNLFDASGTLQSKVTFGTSPAGPSFPTFNNGAGLNNTTISILSQVNVNGAFVAANDANEIGSPGTIGKLLITEVAPWSSGNSPVGSDWFELTNTKATSIDITGWKVDDNSGSFAASLPLNGITSIAPGESVIFLESAAPATVAPLFLNTWFGATAPASLKIGTYTGSGVGLGTGGDAVNIYNSTGTLQASVIFGASSPSAPYRTFDNAQGLNNTTIAILSQVGTNGAFVAKNDATEIGSPGTIVNFVCPSISAIATAPAIVCAGGSTLVTLTASGGVAPYTISGDSLSVKAGVHNYTVTDSSGCTGTASITIAEGTAQPSYSTTNVTANTSYLWNGTTYTASGTYLKTLVNAAGCDSIATLILQITRGNQLPVIKITSPSQTLTVNANSTIVIEANATDADGTVKTVELIVNGTIFKVDSIAPYQFTATNVGEGEYQVLVRATDDSGAIVSSSPVSVIVIGCSGAGSITGEGYANIPGSDVASLTSSLSYPNSPDVTASLTSFEYRNLADNYGGRVRGYFCAPASGLYRFNIAADDQAGLWLSTDDNPANKVLIAYTQLYTGFREFNRYSTQRSALISLVQGGRYYIETLHKEANGPDHLTVAVTYPSGQFEAPIQGSRLSPILNAPAQNTARGVAGFAAAMEIKTIPGIIGLQVKATPNPTTDHFTLTTQSSDPGTLDVRVLDVQGRVVDSKMKVPANSVIQIGERLTAGIYFVEITQGAKKQRLKLVKQ